jgi:cytochrome bd-type quinol oxidase subunit 2
VKGPVPSELKEKTAIDRDLLQTLAGLNTDANIAVVQRTRRAMMVAANEMRAARERSRRQLALILFVLGSLVVLITPAVWVVADDLFEGEHFQDPPTLAVSLVVTFISTIFAALIVTWRSRQSRGREEL